MPLSFYTQCLPTELPQTAFVFEAEGRGQGLLSLKVIIFTFGISPNSTQECAYIHLWYVLNSCVATQTFSLSKESSTLVGNINSRTKVRDDSAHNSSISGIQPSY